MNTVKSPELDVPPPELGYVALRELDFFSQYGRAWSRSKVPNTGFYRNGKDHFSLLAVSRLYAW